MVASGVREIDLIFEWRDVFFFVSDCGVVGKKKQFGRLWSGKLIKECMGSSSKALITLRSFLKVRKYQRRVKKNDIFSRKKSIDREFSLRSKQSFREHTP